jgi:cytochrome c-type biogenesis protein CcmH
MRQIAIYLLVALLPVLQPVHATVFETRDFASAEQRARYKDLVKELRCLVCQNQSLADSNAELAADLREQVHTMIREGKSDAQIIDFMVARYGDFVLYRPPLKGSTVLLWIGPFIVGLVALASLLWIVRRRRQSQSAVQLNEAERQRLTNLVHRSFEEQGPR